MVVTGGSVAATVNGKSIPMRLFKDFMNYGVAEVQGQEPTKTIYQQNMQQLIQNELVLQWAHAHGIKAKASQVNAQINSAIKSGGGKKAFESTLKQRGLRMADFRYIAKVNVITPQVENKISPLPKSGPIASAEHILIAKGVNKCSKKPLTNAAAKALAQHILTEVKNGGNFAALAKKCSTDTTSAVKGGVLYNSTNTKSKLLYPGNFVPPFDKAVFTGPVGTPQLVHSQYGYHVLIVLSRHTGAYPTSVRTTAQQFYFSQWLKTRQDKAQITKFAKLGK